MITPAARRSALPPRQNNHRRVTSPTLATQRHQHAAAQPRYTAPRYY
ncbi:hypothetical protein [Varibaculum cambriense]